MAREPPKGQLPVMLNTGDVPSRAHTPVTAYNPSGTHASPMPVGKYYPSNYEKRYSRSHKQQQQKQHPRPPTSAPFVPSSVKSESHVPTSRSTNLRTDSEAEHRLRQYQRDMVAQASQAARHIAGRNGGAKEFAASFGMHGVSLHKFQQHGGKPTSPRLAPLGSPGPVTPMDLEGGGSGGYLTRGRAVRNADAGAESRQIETALREEAERQRKEGSGSPAVEAGGYGF